MTTFKLEHIPHSALLTQLAKVLGSGIGHSALLWAPSGYGKSAFLKHDLASAAEGWGWAVARIELKRTQSALDIVRLLEEAVSPHRQPWFGYADHEQPDTIDQPLPQRLAAALQTLADAPGRGSGLLVLDGIEQLEARHHAWFCDEVASKLRRLERKVRLVVAGASAFGAAPFVSGRGGGLISEATPLRLEPAQAYIEDRRAVLASLPSARGARNAFQLAWKAAGECPRLLDEILGFLVEHASLGLKPALSAWSATSLNGPERIWGALQPAEQLLLKQAVLRTEAQLFGREVREQFAAATGANDLPSLGTLQAVQQRLMRRRILVPTGRHGGYAVESQALTKLVTAKGR